MMTDSQEALPSPRQANRLRPVESQRIGRGIGSRKQECGRRQTRQTSGKIFIAHRTRHDYVELPASRLRALRQNPDISESPSGLPQEHRFPLVGLDQCHRAIRSSYSNREAGKSSPGTQIHDPSRFRGKMGCQEKRFPIMTFGGFLNIIDGRQVQNSVPAPQQLVMGLERVPLLGTQRKLLAEEITKRG